jgi:type IV fimbrial biogenesis protein FimT
MSSRCPSGFSLIELMVTIAVAAVLLAIGLPSFQSSLRSNRTATATNELLSSLALARSEGIRSTHSGGVCPSSDGNTCGTDWAKGWLVFADQNSNGALDAGETVLRYSRMNAKMTMAGQGNVRFDARGRLAGGGDLVLRPDECGGQPLQRTLEINGSGQVKVQKGACQ